jgi:hypothetical protein
MILAHYRIEILTFEDVNEIKYDKDILFYDLGDDGCAIKKIKR